MDKRLAVDWARILAVFLMLAIIFNTVLVKTSQAFDPLGAIKNTLTVGAYTRASSAATVASSAYNAMMLACSPAKAAVGKAASIAAGALAMLGVTILGTGNPGWAGIGSAGSTAASGYADVASQNECAAMTASYIAAQNKADTESAAYFKAREESIAANFVDVLSIAFNSMKTVAIQQFAQKTAEFLAAGATGQKAMFNTQGLSSLLTQTGDAAVGGFVDSLSKSINVDLCNPDATIKAGILMGLRSPELQKTNCSATKLLTNWQESAKNPNLSRDFRSALNPNQNSITYFLIAQDNANSAASKAVDINKTLYQTNQGWNSVQTQNGQIKTPASLIQWMSAEEYRQSVNARTTKTFMGGTAADVQDAVNIFLSTFLNQTINYYAKGMFNGSLLGGNTSGGNGSNGGSTGNGTNNGNNPITNPDASPQNNNQTTAKENSLTYFSYDGKAGNTDDILLKLTQCPNPDNPGPTDCVIDADFADAIRGLDTGKIFVKDLPDSILNRKFATKNSSVANFETDISFRAVMILREYRIVPVGWEIAADYIANHQNDNPVQNQYQDKIFTLKDLINLNNVSSGLLYPDSELKGLIDPYWILKAPQVFCRRVGYGPDTSGGTAVSRSENYCADTQQCLQEDAQGKCLSYGYCTEEQKFWRLKGDTCEPKYNTCTSFETKDSNVTSYLANSLDYRNCNAEDAGCAWYSYAYRDVSDYWQHITNSMKLIPCSDTNPAWVAADYGCEVSANGTLADVVNVWHNVSGNQKIILDKACTNPLGCKFGVGTPLTCTIPYGGIRCQVGGCNYLNLLAGLNANFAACNGLPNGWSQLGNGISSNSSFSCSSQGQTNNALNLFANNNSILLSLNSPTFVIDKIQRYRLTFYTKVNAFNSGSVTVGLDDGTGSLNEGSKIPLTKADAITSQAWQKKSIEFDVRATSSSARIQILTSSDASAQVMFDDFKLEAIDNSCSNDSPWLTLGAISTPSDKIYFDHDVVACDSSDAGCSQFIRTKSRQGATRLGSNLLPNSGLDDWINNLPVGWSSFGIINQESNNKIDGTYSASIKSLAACSRVGESCDFNAYLSTGYIAVRPNINYILSAYAADFNDNESATVKVDYYGENTRTPISTISSDFPLDKTFGQTNSDSPQNPIPDISYKFKTGDDISYVKITFSPANHLQAGGMYLDDVKLEETDYNVDTPTDYTAYDPSAQRPANQLVYLKKAPDYLNCYVTLGKPAAFWPTSSAAIQTVLTDPSRSPKCANYSQVCSTKEVGCEAYTPANDDPMVPGVAKQNDICPGECLGYSSYRQEATNFVSYRSNINFIANKNLKRCTQEAAGCDEFTNLDKTGSGAEVREYYTGLKVCQKENPTTYYNWEGNDTSGYQLKVYSLKISQPASMDPNAPCVNLRYNADGTNRCEDFKNGDPITSTPSIWPSENAVNHLPGNLQLYNDNLFHFSDYINYLVASSTITNSTILNQSLADDLHKYGLCLKQEIKGYKSGNIEITPNIDCREFYDSLGRVSYRLLSRTITVSADCHPYRRTQTQNNDTVAKSDCDGSSGYWKATTGTAGDCIYMAIPGEGSTCSSNNAGCREYTGNQGNNIYNAVNDSFDSGSGIAGWTGGVPASMSNYVGGNSLKNNSTSLTREVEVTSTKGYILSFWAKTDATPFNIPLITLGADGDLQYFTSSTFSSSTKKVTGEWEYYEFGPVFLNGIQSNSGQLKFNNIASTIYLDNVILKETRDSVFAIENSWFTPISCDNELLDPVGAHCGGSTSQPKRCLDTMGAMLGCRAYTDSADQKFNLRSFTNLCRPEAVGCEALIDTHNSNSPVASVISQGIQDDKVPTNVTVPADSMAYIVNNEEFRCPLTEKGCSLFGLPKINAFDEVYGYSEVALKNDPERYNTDLCKHNELWCNIFTSNGATAYFKEPGTKTCQYKAVNGGIADWYLTGTDVLCATTDYQTIGNGVAELKLQPLGVFNNIASSTDSNYRGFAGSCPSSQDTCTEYVDPLAKIYTPIILNSTLEGSLNLRSYWSVDINGVMVQRVSLDTGYLYTFTASSSDAIDIGMSCANGSSFWSPDNSLNTKNNINFSSAGSSFHLLYPTHGNTAVRFYLSNSTNNKVDCSVYVNTPGDTTKISLVKSGVYYYKSNSVDRTSCNGQVDEKNGCVLLNERNEINYASLNSTRSSSYLKFSAWLTSLKLDKQPIAPVMGGITNGGTIANDSNSILKVEPDRKCASWLYCTTYQKADTASGKTAFDNGDKCLDLGLCRSMDDNGNCLDYESNINSTTTATLASEYIDSSVNKTGYAKLGKVRLGVKGFYPFQYMPQFGNSAFVPNGGFESVVDHGEQGLEPLGWSAVTPVSSTLAIYQSDYPGGSYNPGFLARVILVGSEDYAWKPDYFSVITDPAVAAKEGSYLQLNGNHYIASEAVNLVDGIYYTLSYEINTKGLLPKTATSTFELCLVPFGREITEFNASTPGNCIPGTVSSVRADEASGGWQERQIVVNGNDNHFVSTTPTSATSSPDGSYICNPGIAGVCQPQANKQIVTLDRRFRVVMHNFYNDVVTSTEKNVHYVGGYSMVDNIDIKPKLEINASSSVERDCRLYPTSDALSCNYIKNGTFYNSWYGYCLLQDPANVKNCLQWWPVDRLKDDNIDEVRAYNGSRAPLYYCINSTNNLAEWHPQYGSGGPWSSQGPDQNTPGQWLFSIGGVQKWGTAYSQAVKCMDNPECSSQYKKSRNLKQGKNNGVTISFSDKIFISTNRGVGAENFAFSDSYSSSQEILRYYGHNKTDGQWYPLEGLQSDNGSTRQFRAYPSAKYLDQHPEYVTSTPFFMDAIQVICAQAGNGSACTFYDLRYKNYLSVPKETAACVDLVQVVDAFGQSSPYYRRIADGSAFKVRGADYGADYSPFGSAVIEGKPENLDSNPLMDGNQAVRADAPNLSLVAPYQTRAGTLSIYYDIPSYLTAINIIYDVNAKLGFCSRRINVVCNDAILPCNSDETCNPVDSKDGFINKIRYFRGTEDLRRLFLKDYGWWQFISYQDSNGCALQNVTTTDDSIDDNGNLVVGPVITYKEYACSSTDPMILSDPQAGSSVPDTSGPGDPNPNNEYADILRGTDIPMPGKVVDGTNARYQRFYNSILPDWNKTNKVDPGIGSVTFSTSSFPNLWASMTRTVIGRGVVNMNFSVMINAEQLPLKAYTVNWGDGSKTEVTDANLFDKSGNSAISLYHFYDYFKVANAPISTSHPTCTGRFGECPQYVSGKPIVPICVDGVCNVKITITVVDSWGAKRTDYPVWIHVNRDGSIPMVPLLDYQIIRPDPIPADTIDPLDATPANPWISNVSLSAPSGSTYTISYDTPTNRYMATSSSATAFLSFTFNTTAGQWPIRFWNVDWGDNTNSSWNGAINNDGSNSHLVTSSKQYFFTDLQFMYRKNPPSNGTLRCYDDYNDEGYNPNKLTYKHCDVTIRAYVVDNLNMVASTTMVLEVSRNGSAAVMCGDGTVAGGEQCDASNMNGVVGGSCTANCKWNLNSKCGNGITSRAKPCDCGYNPGSSGNYFNGVTSYPTNIYCHKNGDTVNEPRQYNSDTGPYCTETCNLPTCGDGIWQPELVVTLPDDTTSTEQCDLGKNKNGKGSYSCDANCQTVVE